MGQITGSKSIVVNAPIEVAFAGFTDPEMQIKWIVEPHELRDYTPPLGAGSTYKTVSRFMGRDAVQQHEVIEFEPPYQQVLRYTGVGNGESQYTCEAVERGTKVMLRFDANMSGFLAQLMAPFIRRQMDKRMTADLQSFKEFIEG
jgi:uncharacterized protein YndB with AHSA1/START domain